MDGMARGGRSLVKMTAGWPDDLADLSGVRAVQQAVDDVVERPVPWEGGG